MLLEGLCAFLLAVIIGTLLEYWVHRLMHWRFFLGRRHAEHHRRGTGQGVVGEFFDYTIGVVPVLWVGFLYSLPAGIGFVAGGLGYAVFAAYSHQLQHERPELCFWLRRPVHYLHHHQHMWRHNFGISLDIWDRVFGTYKPVAWQPERRPWQYPLRNYLQIQWWYGRLEPRAEAQAQPTAQDQVV